MDKRKAIRNMAMRLGGQATPGQIVEALQNYDVDVSESFVAKVKMQMERQDARAERERSKQPPKDKSRRRPQQRKIPKQGK